ncbi:hypothetical protein N7462_011072 [Penicillium macrosclerotiorum]|uniref:uncharacterized protein n=1 Tax=Penicillium macrosclerotiorum TaxID=303699 RepID=UPI00254806E2|nr:uncharacterized protein N7462_011072 [Penicillium macrosclerotiorum]KAJ5666663.1 hypothetical protein N7462_011072 [Penicillium macrosclerotiorum]
MGAPEMLLAVPKDDLEVEPSIARYEYDPWLLDDHPLRSHPTQCIPGLGTFFTEWLSSTRRRWKETLCHAGCLVLICLAVLQCFRFLPSPASGKGLPRPPASSSHLGPREWHVKCTFPHSDPRHNALAQSLAAGCDGLRTDMWRSGQQLQMGPFRATSEAAQDLSFHLETLLTGLESHKSQNFPSRTVQLSLPPSTGDLAAPAEPARKFMLVLDAKSALDDLYPLLVAQLDALRQRGLLTHWDGARIIPRAVTLVVTGESVPASDCSISAYADVFWSSEDAFIFPDDVSAGLGSPICAV